LFQQVRRLVVVPMADAGFMSTPLMPPFFIVSARRKTAGRKERYEAVRREERKLASHQTELQSRNRETKALLQRRLPNMSVKAADHHHMRGYG
jgi:hypothetical protein